MELYEYVGRKIKLCNFEGIEVEGRCIGYTQALDNEPEVEEIDIKREGYSGIIGVTAPEIKSIEIIED